jgi:phosphoglycolate phosphatase
MYLVLFDIDGTLMHSGGCGRAATRLALQDVFGTIGDLDSVNFPGRTDWEILNAALIPAGVPAATILAQIAAYDRAVTQRLTEIIGEFPVKPCPGGPQIVTALRESPQVVIGLVTGNVAGIAPVKLRAAGYDPADFKIGAYGSEGWKRAMLPPLALRRARGYAGVDFAGDRIVIVGDTPGDIACAASVGGRTIAVATGAFGLDELQRHQPTHAFADLRDVDAVLAAIFGNGYEE